MTFKLKSPFSDKIWRFISWGDIYNVGHYDFAKGKAVIVKNRSLSCKEFVIFWRQNIWKIITELLDKKGVTLSECKQKSHYEGKAPHKAC